MPESESEQREAQVNLTEAAQDPNPISEEPKTSYAKERKPRSMSFYFKFMQLIIVPIYLCIKLQELIGTLDAWSYVPMLEH